MLVRILGAVLLIAAVVWFLTRAYIAAGAL